MLVLAIGLGCASCGRCGILWGLYIPGIIAPAAMPAMPACKTVSGCLSGPAPVGPEYNHELTFFCENAMKYPVNASIWYDMISSWAVYVGMACVQLKFELVCHHYVPIHVFASDLQVLEALPMI